MIKIRIADLNIEIDNKHAYLEEICREYLTDANGTDFSVSANNDEIRAEDGGSGFDDGYLESLAIYRKIADKIIEYDGFLMHGSVISVDGCGLCFSALSGVGKTTHTAYWCSLLGEHCFVVNGDKPLFRIIGGTLYAYGTPWCGKEGINRNTRVSIKAFCTVHRADENRTAKTSARNGFKAILTAAYKPSDPKKYARTLDLLTAAASRAEFYDVYCTNDISAARTAYETIMG